MNVIGRTQSGYRVVAIAPGESSPMANHRGGEIAVDEKSRIMFAWGVFVTLYGTESIMKACESY